MVWKTLQYAIQWSQFVERVGVVLLLAHRPGTKESKGFGGIFQMYLPCILLHLLCDGTNRAFGFRKSHPHVYIAVCLLKVTPNLRGHLPEKKFVRALFLRKPPQTI